MLWKGAALLMMVLLLGAGPGTAAPPALEPGLRPGDVYREYRQVMLGNTWRVVDPNTKQAGARVDLPNPVHHLQVDDLEGAVRAEAVIDFWGGHYRTSEKRVRFNGHAWIPVPELTTTPQDELPSSYMQQWNPVFPVPLSDLKAGDNTFEGICGDQIDGFHWGQWGWYGLTLRIYYGPGKPHPIGRVASPASGAVLSENPRIAVAVGGGVGVARVDVFGYYEGYDEDGDGLYRDWHHFRHYDGLSGHIGTVTSSPYEVTWDTHWVPDQPGGVALLARLQGTNGVYFVTDAVQDLSLQRVGSTVQLYRASAVPPLFSVRDNETKSCTVRLPRTLDPTRVREAALQVRTWNGWGENFALNGWSDTLDGREYNYACTVRPVPAAVLRRGANQVSFHSPTVHHGVEVLWPGPALVIRSARARAEAIQQPYYFPITVHAAGVARQDAVAEVAVNFAELLTSLEVPQPLDPVSLRVVEVDDAGGILDGEVAFQFDAESDPTRGVLLFLLGGSTDGNAARHFRVYFAPVGAARYRRAEVPTQVRGTAGVKRAGLASFRIQAGANTYYYDVRGAGFASLEDAQGRDWISYRPGGGPAGEYRGIPNLVYPEGHLHPGRPSSHSRLAAAGPLRASIESETEDGKWACRWDIYPAWATLTVLRADHPYWFLYEGTPAGELEPERDRWERSDGQGGSASAAWSAHLPSPAWVRFAKPPVSDYVLRMIQPHPEGAANSYYPLQGKMTVFGFGRRDVGEPQPLLTQVPARFLVLLTEASPAALSRAVRAATTELRTVVGRPRKVG